MQRKAFDMRGIALIIRPNPNAVVFDRTMDAIAPRGDVRETSVVIGTTAAPSGAK